MHCEKRLFLSSVLFCIVCHKIIWVKWMLLLHNMQKTVLWRRVFSKWAGPKLVGGGRFPPSYLGKAWDWEVGGKVTLLGEGRTFSSPFRVWVWVHAVASPHPRNTVWDYGLLVVELGLTAVWGTFEHTVQKGWLVISCFCYSRQVLSRYGKSGLVRISEYPKEPRLQSLKMHSPGNKSHWIQWDLLLSKIFKLIP